MNLSQAIAVAEAAIEDRRTGLPDEVFGFVSSITPMINVDLLIRDGRGQTLLTWRADDYCGQGWHVPGGIIRFKETIAGRIQAIARAELETEVRFSQSPIAMHELMASDRNVRGHFLSLLYRCDLLRPPSPDLQLIDGEPRNGMWRWHERCPENLIAAHAIYRPFLGPLPRNGP